MRRWLIRVGLVLGVVFAAGCGAAASANASVLCPWDGHGWFHAGLAGDDIVAILEEGGVSTTGNFVCAAEVEDALLIVSPVDDDLWRYPVLGICARGYYIFGLPEEEFTDDRRRFDTNQNGLICARQFVPLPVGPDTRLVREYADDRCPEGPCLGFDTVEGPPEARWSDGVLTGWNTSGSGPGISLAAVPLAGRWAAELANTGTKASTCTLNDSPNVVGTTAESGTYMYRLFVEPETSGQTLRLRVREYRGGTERVGSKTTDVRLWPRGTGAAVITYTPVAPGESTLDFHASVVNAAPGTCFRATTLTVLTGPTSPPPEPGPNFVANDGFEFDRSGWNTTDTSTALTRAYGGHSGHWAANLTNTGTTAASCTLNDSPNWVRSTSAGTYEASLWVRADTAAATLRLRLREWSDGVLAGSARTAVTLTTEWQPVTVSYTPSAPGASTLDFSAYVLDAPPGTCFYADDASVVRFPGPLQASPD